MIFYFSGTGNSKDVANKISEKTQDKIYDIAELLMEDKVEFELDTGENIGFVYPVYFYSVPEILKSFVEKLKVKQNSSNYGFIVVTCGGSIAESGDYLARLLYERNIRISSVFSILMPDNAMIYYNIPGMDVALKRLDDAYEKIDEIVVSINEKKRQKIGKAAFAKMCDKLYKKALATKKFKADEACTGCGLCAKRCPEGAIELKDGRPVWVKEKCSKCLRCINSCPQLAIQYGNKTLKRNRYTNPNVKL